MRIMDFFSYHIYFYDNIHILMLTPKYLKIVYGIIVYCSEHAKKIVEVVIVLFGWKYSGFSKMLGTIDTKATSTIS